MAFDGIYTSGIDLIRTERNRQVLAKGFTSRYDEQHKNKELLLAAIVYITNTFSDAELEEAGEWPEGWGDVQEKMKDKTDRECLIIAGALIAAELDRLSFEKRKVTPQDWEP